MSSDPKAIALTMLGIMVFAAGVGLDIAGDDPRLIFVGTAVLALGLLLPFVREFEIGLSSFKVKTEPRTEVNEFSSFVEVERAQLHRFAVLLIGDDTHAQTAVEDTFTNLYLVWRRLPEVQRGSYVLCRLIHLALGRSMLTGLSAAQPDLDSNETAEPLRTARILACLPQQQRAALLLKHYAGLSDDAVARIMGRTELQIAHDLRIAVSLVDQTRTAKGIVGTP